jgi:hypothetical protein
VATPKIPASIENLVPESTILVSFSQVLVRKSDSFVQKAFRIGQSLFAFSATSESIRNDSFSLKTMIDGMTPSTDGCARHLRPVATTGSKPL